jgi:mannan endo-1,4-beta-mannosidase
MYKSTLTSLYSSNSFEQARTANVKKMKSIIAALGALALSTASLATPVSQTSQTKQAASNSTNSWMGSNLYFLQGLKDADQDSWIKTIASDGAKVVRVWVNEQVGGSCTKGSKLSYNAPQLETSVLGTYNKATLDTLDRTLVKLEAAGLKAIISAHDGNSLTSGRW